MGRVWGGTAALLAVAAGAVLGFRPGRAVAFSLLLLTAAALVLGVILLGAVGLAALG